MAEELHRIDTFGTDRALAYRVILVRQDLFDCAVFQPDNYGALVVAADTAAGLDVLELRAGNAGGHWTYFSGKQNPLPAAKNLSAGSGASALIARKRLQLLI
jgi:hypothetical protein